LRNRKTRREERPLTYSKDATPFPPHSTRSESWQT
jgi:hypothetical protein